MANYFDFLGTKKEATEKDIRQAFRRLARKLDAPLNERVMFDKEQHFAGQHETEMLVHIGPFGSADISAAQ